MHYNSKGHSAYACMCWVVLGTLRMRVLVGQQAYINKHRVSTMTLCAWPAQAPDIQSSLFDWYSSLCSSDTLPPVTLQQCSLLQLRMFYTSR